MKNKGSNKLSLDKIKIAKLQHPKHIMGGLGNEEPPYETHPEHCETNPIVCWESISTKTVPVSGQTCVCI
ncbi:class I lanthipeptide [Aquimarina litoralis]|uniref:class I lanthipeptide n=1 Tax=Aquimarina litoralis TaxID=584605 RepID=UPI001C58ABE0|nr:class I lanthipeptide [Aquimarina litoralis]MBW1298266.1 hypothetical protein [Aquimarina litoralis]